MAGNDAPWPGHLNIGCQTPSDHCGFQPKGRSVDHGNRVAERVRHVQLCLIVAQGQIARVRTIQIRIAGRNLRYLLKRRSGSYIKYTDLIPEPVSNIKSTTIFIENQIFPVETRLELADHRV